MYGSFQLTCIRIDLCQDQPGLNESRFQGNGFFQACFCPYIFPEGIVLPGHLKLTDGTPVVGCVFTLPVQPAGYHKHYDQQEKSHQYFFIRGIFTEIIPALVHLPGISPQAERIDGCRP